VGTESDLIVKESGSKELIGGAPVGIRGEGIEQLILWVRLKPS